MSLELFYSFSFFMSFLRKTELPTTSPSGLALFLDDKRALVSTAASTSTTFAVGSEDIELPAASLNLRLRSCVDKQNSNKLVVGF